MYWNLTCLNKAFKRITCYISNELLGKKLTLVQLKDQITLALIKFWEIIENESVQDFELDFRNQYTLADSSHSLIDEPPWDCWGLYDYSKWLKFMIDSVLMWRVFITMITNAVQAIPDRCKLTITASKLMGDVLIKIEDTDVGIPEENLAKFF